MPIFMKKSQINFTFWYAINHAIGIFEYITMFKTKLESLSPFNNTSKIYYKMIFIKILFCIFKGGGLLDSELEKNLYLCHLLNEVKVEAMEC